MNLLKEHKRIVVKIGTSTLTHSTGRLNLKRIDDLSRVLSDIKNNGNEIVLVSSGAISAGTAKMSLEKRPSTIQEKQAVAAVGQTELMRLYERFFSSYGYTVGQILMTRDVVDDEHRLSLVRNTFAQLLKMGCIPIVNENDSVSSEEIQFGGNDTLSAYVAIVCNADLIINLTDIEGLYDCDPRKFENAKLIGRVDEINDTIRSYAGGVGSERGTGGMITKIRAAEISVSEGIPMLITNGRDPMRLYDIMEGKHMGTYFAADKSRRHSENDSEKEN